MGISCGSICSFDDHLVEKIFSHPQYQRYMDGAVQKVFSGKTSELESMQAKLYLKLCGFLGLSIDDLCICENNQFFFARETARERVDQLVNIPSFWEHFEHGLDYLSLCDFGRDVLGYTYDSSIQSKYCSYLRQVNLILSKVFIVEDDLKQKEGKREKYHLYGDSFVTSPLEANRVSIQNFYGNFRRELISQLNDFEQNYSKSVEHIYLEKIACILGCYSNCLVTRKKDGFALNEELIRRKFETLTGISKYWDSLEGMLDYITTYYHGKDTLEYVYDYSTNSSYFKVLQELWGQLSDALMLGFQRKVISSGELRKRLRWLNFIMDNSKSVGEKKK